MTDNNLPNGGIVPPYILDKIPGQSIFTHPPRDEDKKCVRCGMGTFYITYEFATGMGHIYSEAGAREYKITGLCEWCFDEICDIEIINEKENR